jgi:hypothetical protein
MNLMRANDVEEHVPTLNNKIKKAEQQRLPYRRERMFRLFTGKDRGDALQLRDPLGRMDSR